ncbi:MAG: type III pantothenate kinase, partial [Candidatus Puniceispirillaceae bacterium]
MILTVDCGNTNIVMTLFSEDDGAVLASWRLRTLPLADADRLAHSVTEQMAGLENTSALQQVVVATVVPGAADSLHEMALLLTQKPPMMLSDPDISLPLEIDVLSPHEVGEDRLVNVAGLDADTSLPCLIIDFGTATTIDLVRASETATGLPIYAGGIITPGVHRSVEALVAAAAKLEPIEIAEFDSTLPVLGRNTDEAMKSGILWGYVCLINGLIDRLEVSQGIRCDAVATGGLAPVFA